MISFIFRGIHNSLLSILMFLDAGIGSSSLSYNNDFVSLGFFGALFPSVTAFFLNILNFFYWVYNEHPIPIFQINGRMFFSMLMWVVMCWEKMNEPFHVDNLNQKYFEIFFCFLFILSGLVPRPKSQFSGTFYVTGRIFFVVRFILLIKQITFYLK